MMWTRRYDPADVDVVCTPGLMGGMQGTRVPAETILATINAGETVEELYDAYPYLPAGSAEAVVRWAQANGRFVLLPFRRNV